MKQKIALDYKAFEDFIIKCSNSDMDGIYNFAGFYSKLLEYHILIREDLSSNSNKWNDTLWSIKNKLEDKSQFRVFFNDLFIRSEKFEISKEKLSNACTTEFSEFLAEKTDDKILITNNSIEKGTEIQTVDTEYFINTNKFKKNCRLLRYPKKINFNSGDLLNNLKLFSPYLRNAKSLDIFDKYSFKNSGHADPIDFISELIKVCVEKPEVVIYYEIEPLNVREAVLKKRISEFISNLSFKNYPSSELHDRYIIVNKNETTISFSASFNNIQYTSNSFRINKKFSISFEKGKI